MSPGVENRQSDRYCVEFCVMVHKVNQWLGAADQNPPMVEIRTLQLTEDVVSSRTARYALIAFGWLCVAIGLVGIVVPGLPTTVFILIAAWAFSRSSERFQRWLYEHPRFGPTIVAWRERGAIPLKAKVLAIVMMSVSLAWIVFYVADGWLLPFVVGTIMVGAGAYVVSRPSE